MTQDEQKNGPREGFLDIVFRNTEFLDAVLLIAFCVVTPIGMLLLINNVATSPEGLWSLIPVLLVFVMGSLFPVSAVAYRVFQRSKQLQHLEFDYGLIGVVDESLRIEDRYDRSYNTWHFITYSILPTLLTIAGTTFVLYSFQPFAPPRAIHITY